MVTHIINKYCLPSQYHREDIKICLFVCSLDGDAMKWLSNWPKDYIDSLQSIVNAFKDKYIKQDDSPCAPSTMQNNEIDFVENSTTRDFKTILRMNPFVPRQHKSMIVVKQKQVVKSVLTMISILLTN